MTETLAQDELRGDADDPVRPERSPGGGVRRASPPALGAAGGARGPLAEGRVLAVGPVRVLHGPDRRQGVRQLPGLPGEGGGEVGHDPGGLRPRRARALCRRVRRDRGAPVRLLHAGDRRQAQGVARQEGRGPHAGGRGAPSRRSPVPLHGLHQNPRCRRGAGQRQHPRRDARRAASGRGRSSTRASSTPSGDCDYVDDIRVPGLLHGALRLADHARADVVRIDTAAALAVPGVEAVFTAADVPGQPAGRHHPHRLARVHPRRRADLVPR